MTESSTDVHLSTTHTKGKRKKLIPLFALFFVINGALFALGTRLQRSQIDQQILLMANVFLFGITLLMLMLQRKALLHPNPNVFIRSVMSGLMIKLFSCVALVLLYWYLAGAAFNNSTVIAGLFIYLMYLAVEVAILSSLNRAKHA